VKKASSIVLFAFLVTMASARIIRSRRRSPSPAREVGTIFAVDEAARRLYVSHGTQVEVLDVDSGTVVGNISNTLGVHGIAIARELGRGFVSNGQSSTVTIFDLKVAEADRGRDDRQKAGCHYFRSSYIASVCLLTGRATARLRSMQRLAKLLARCT